MFRSLRSSGPLAMDAGLLILRLSTGFFLATHGWEKLMNFKAWSVDFPDPLHVGSPVSLALCISAEFFASVFLAAGLFTRYALLLLIGNMLVIAFMVHGNDPLDKQEHAFLFLFPQIVIFCTGPGKYSLDRKWNKS